MDQGLRRRVVTALILAGIYLVVLFAAAYSIHARVFLIALGACAVMIGILEFRAFHDEGAQARDMYLLIGLLPYLPFVLSPVFMGDLPQPIHAYVLILWCAGVLLQCMFVQGWLLLGVRGQLHECFLIAREAHVFTLVVGTGASALLFIPLLPGGVAALFWMSLVVSFCDIAAYFTGKKFGYYRLSPIISPGKTYAGTIGGSLAGVVTGVPLLLLYDVSIGFFPALLLSVCVVIAAQLGDLAVSYLKRIHNKKDSGSLLPGHGGILDRLDGFFGAAPVLFVALCAYLLL